MADHEQMRDAVEAERVRVGILCLRGTTKPLDASPYYMRRELARSLGETTLIGDVHRYPLLKKLTGRGLGRVSPNVCARRALKALKRKPQDLLVGLYASQLIAELPPTSAPLVYFTDGAAHDIVDLYPQFSRLSPQGREAMIRSEEIAAARSDLIIVHSAWAAQAFVEKVGVEAEKVHVLPIGSNFGLTSPGLEPSVIEPDSPIELIFIGRDWERKGLPMSVKVVDELNDRGVLAHLSVFGCDPPASVLSENVTCYGPFDRAKPAEARDVEEAIIRAHVNILPSISECYGVGAGEVAALYTPSLVTNVQGLPECVLDGVTGAVLSSDAEPGDFADVIMSWAHSPETYRKLCLGAEHDARTRLNWASWGQAVRDLVRAKLL